MNAELAAPLILVFGAILGAAFTDLLKHRSEIRNQERRQLEALVFGLGEIREKFNALFGDADLHARYRELSSVFFRTSGIARIYCPEAFEPIERAAWQVSLTAKALAKWLEENPDAPVGVTPRHLIPHESQVANALALADKAALKAMTAANSLPPLVPVPKRVSVALRSAWQRIKTPRSRFTRR